MIWRPLSRATLSMAAVAPGRFELPPSAGTSYVGFADAAGGSGKDLFTAAVAHRDRLTKRIVVDALRSKESPVLARGSNLRACRFLQILSRVSD